MSAKRFYSSRSDSFLCPVFFCFSQQQHGSSFVDLARVILRRSYDDGSSVDSIYVIHRMPVVARKAKFDWQAIQHQSKERLMQYSSQKLESSKSFCNTYRRTAWSILFIDKLKIGTGVLVLFSQSFQSIRFFKTFSQGYDFFVASHPPWAPLFAPSLRGRNNAAMSTPSLLRSQVTPRSLPLSTSSDCNSSCRLLSIWVSFQLITRHRSTRIETQGLQSSRAIPANLHHIVSAQYDTVRPIAHFLPVSCDRSRNKFKLDCPRS